MGRIANAKAIIVQSAVFILIGGDVDIAVIEVVIRVIPIAVESVSDPRQ